MVERPPPGPSKSDARRWLKRIIWGGLLGGVAGCSVLVDTSGLVGGGSDGGTISPGGDGGALSTGSSESGGSSPGSPGDGDAGGSFDAGGTGHDAGSQGDVGGGTVAIDSGPTWGPVDPTSNCGSCGNACDTDSGTPSCTGGSCDYVCSAGRADCNQASPNTDGCECATPGCCATGCQTTHEDGVGQPYYDCNPTQTVTELAALEACTAYAGGDANACSSGWNCSGANTKYVCFSNDNGTDCTSFCWGYSGSRAGKVDDCSCPSNPVGSWN